MLGACLRNGRDCCLHWLLLSEFRSRCWREAVVVRWVFRSPRLASVACVAVRSLAPAPAAAPTDDCHITLLCRA